MEDTNMKYAFSSSFSHRGHLCPYTTFPITNLCFPMLCRDIDVSAGTFMSLHNDSNDIFVFSNMLLEELAQ